MKTKSVNVLNLCVPCACHCKYCLLSYERKLIGVEFHRGLEYAKKFQEWLKYNHPDVSFMYYFGYSMDTPFLKESLNELDTLNSPMPKFLQLNGI